MNITYNLGYNPF